MSPILPGKPFRFSFAAFFLFILTAFTPCFALGPVKELPVDQSFLDDFVSKSWTTEDGLPGMTITDMVQDEKGYIYIGTYDGIVRFDGVEFTVYSRAVDEKYDFATAHVLFKDSKGNIWIGHNDEGITCMGPNGYLKKYTVDDGLVNNKVNGITEDLNHNIWIGTAVGPCYLTPEGKVMLPELDAGIDEKITVGDMFCDTAGRVWISTGMDLYVYEENLLRRFPGFSKLDTQDVYSVRQDRSGALWFAVGPCYAVCIKGGEETVYDVSHPHKKPSSVSMIMQDSSGNYWVACDAGVTVIHNGSYTYYDTQNGLPDDGVTLVLEDDEGNIWLGLNRGGLGKLSRGKFLTVPTESGINSICEDTYRNLVWLGSDNGLLCYRNNQFVDHKLYELTKGLRIRHVGLTSDNELLVSTFSTDIAQIVMKPNGEIKTWSVEDGIAGNRCRVSIKTSWGDYYVGTAQGLTVIHRDGSLDTISKKLSMENTYIMWLYEDVSGQIWVGTNGGGVYVLKDEEIQRHYTSEDGLAGNVIFKIYAQDDRIFICTGTGLSILNLEAGSFSNFNSFNGLGTDSVFQSMTDNTGTVWITTNKGILSVKMNELQEVMEGKRRVLAVHNYGKSDGLNTGGVTSTSLSLKDSQGRLWFTLVDGFAIYDPIKSGSNQRLPRIEIQEYTIDNDRYEYYGEPITVPAGAKRLSIKYTGLTSTSPERVQFSYMMEGFESEYSDWATTRVISYTNMKPGSYKFTVMAMNNDGLESLPSDPVLITKLPYIWQRAWFWVAMILSLALGVFALVRYKLYQMARYQRQLEKKVDERTHELKLANEKAENLLLNILPQDIAAELTEHPDRTIARKHTNATVLFTDIVEFTKMSSVMTPEKIITMLNRLFTKFDERAKKEGVEKIKTIGDAYMAATGLTEASEGDGVEKMVRFAQGLLEDVRSFNENWELGLQIRIGINTGDLVAGVIGKTKFIYDIWGDTVNVASRMESTGEPMKIHVSESTYEKTRDRFSYSGPVSVSVKGKGEMKSYFL